MVEFPFDGFVLPGHRRGKTFVEYWYDEVYQFGRIELIFRGKEICLNLLVYDGKNYVLELRRSGMQYVRRRVNRSQAIEYYISIMQQYFKFTIEELHTVRIRLTKAFNQCCDELEKNYPVFKIMNL